MQRFNRAIKTNDGRMIVPNRQFSRTQSLQQEKAKQYASAGVLTTPGYLRLEVNLTQAFNNIAFQVRENQGGVQNPTERRLKISDTFTVISAALYIGSAAITGPATAPTPAQYASMSLHTFPNPLIFTGSFAALQAIYNSYLEMRVDSTVFVDSLPALGFYRVPQSQQGVGTTAVGPPLQNPIQRDEWNERMYGQVPIVPSIELNGQANTVLNLQLPASVNLASGVGTSQNTAVLFLDGLLNQGAATVQNRVQERLSRRISEADEFEDSLNAMDEDF
jgi:hypothetical protein